MNDSIKEQRAERLLRLATELNRTLLGRPEKIDIHQVAKEWLILNMEKDAYPLALTVLTIALCEMVGMYELATQSGIACVASLLNRDEFSDEELLTMAQDKIARTGQLLIDKEGQSGSAH